MPTAYPTLDAAFSDAGNRALLAEDLSALDWHAALEADPSMALPALALMRRAHAALDDDDGYSPFDPYGERNALQDEYASQIADAEDGG